MKTTYKEVQIDNIAKSLAKKIKNGGVLAMFGDLGTGKTTLSKAITKNLNIKNFKIKSPTYTYIRSFPEKSLYHIDLYRINESDELLELEIQEIFENPRNIVIIEWADKISKILPEKRIDIYLKYIDPTTREIEIK